MGMRIERINNCDAAQFVELLGDIFEHSPWVAERAYLLQPFKSRSDLHRVMVKIVRQASREQRHKLLCQHPELAGREAGSRFLKRRSPPAISRRCRRLKMQ